MLNKKVKFSYHFLKVTENTRHCFHTIVSNNNSTRNSIHWQIYIQNFPAYARPLRDPILSLSHTFSLKSARVGGPRPPPPPNGSTAPTGNPGFSAFDEFTLESQFYYVEHFKVILIEISSIFHLKGIKYRSLKYTLIAWRLAVFIRFSLQAEVFQNYISQITAWSRQNSIQ